MILEIEKIKNYTTEYIAKNMAEELNKLTEYIKNTYFKLGSININDLKEYLTNTILLTFEKLERDKILQYNMIGKATCYDMQSYLMTYIKGNNKNGTSVRMTYKGALDNLIFISKRCVTYNWFIGLYTNIVIDIINHLCIDTYLFVKFTY